MKHLTVAPDAIVSAAFLASSCPESVPVHGLMGVVRLFVFQRRLAGGWKEVVGRRWRLDGRRRSSRERLDLVVGMSPVR